MAIPHPVAMRALPTHTVSSTAPFRWGTRPSSTVMSTPTHPGLQNLGDVDVEAELGSKAQGELLTHRMCLYSSQGCVNW